MWITFMSVCLSAPLVAGQVGMERGGGCDSIKFSRFVLHRRRLSTLKSEHNSWYTQHTVSIGYFISMLWPLSYIDNGRCWVAAYKTCPSDRGECVCALCSGMHAVVAQFRGMWWLSGLSPLGDTRVRSVRPSSLFGMYCRCAVRTFVRERGRGVSQYVRDWTVPSVVEKCQTTVCTRSIRYIFFKHHLYTLSPCTSASHFASIQRREAILS
jgi:hypothetical protein